MQYCTNRDHQIFYKLRIRLACEFDIEFQGLQRLLLLVPIGVGRVKRLMQQRPNSFPHSASILVERSKLLIIFCNFTLQTLTWRAQPAGGDKPIDPLTAQAQC